MKALRLQLILRRQTATGVGPLHRTTASKRPLGSTLGSVLLIILGLARGAGGLVLTVQGPAAVDSSRVSMATAKLLGLGLLVIGVLAVVAAVGVIRRRPHALGFAITVLFLFLLDGALNGYLLFGHPGDRGTAVNLVAAVTIGGLLWAGNRATGLASPTDV